MAFRAKSSTHLISGSCWLWVMAYSHSRSPRDAELGPSPVAARQRRMPALPPDARGLRKAGVSPAMLQSCNGPQRRSAIQPLKGRLASAGLPFSCTASLQRYGARGWRRHWSCGARAVWRRRWDGKIRAPCVIRGVSAAKRAPPWQDMRAMHSRTVLCSAFRMHGAHILPKPARFGCMAAICCQGRALFPSGAPSGMHEARKLPRKGVRERIGAIYRHGKAPENASRENIATDGRPWTHHGEISPPSDVGGRNSRASCHRRAQGECIKA